MIFEGHIRTIKQIAQNTWEVVISHYNDVFYFNAGQYVWIITDIGRMPFSICSSSKDPHNLKFIFRDRNANVFKKDLLRSEPGRKLLLRGPCGSIRISEEGIKTTYIVGGVGIAPVVSIVESLIDTNLDREIKIVFINHEQGEEFYFDKLDLFRNYSTKIEHVKVIGRPSDDFLRNNVDSNSRVFVFGPSDMVDTIYHQLIKIGIYSQNISFDQNYPKVFDFKVDLNDPSLFKNVVDQSANHVVITDANGIILYANKSAEVLTGYTFDEMTGQTPRLWGGEVDPKVYKSLWQTIKVERKPYIVEITNIKKNGEKYDVIATISPILNKNGELLGFMGIEEDISFEKKNRVNMEKMNKLFIDKVTS